MAGLSLLLSTACALAAASLQPSTEDDLQAKSRKGKELMASGRYAEAVPVYRALVKAMPGNPGLLVNLGMALHLAGQDREAVPQLEAALRLQPDSLPANLFLGAADLRLGRLAAAATTLEKAVRLQPENTDARSMLVEALVGLEQYGRAESHLRWLSERTPSDPTTWLKLGRTYEALAAQAGSELLTRNGESAFALALAAGARLERRQRAAAFHLYRQAIDRAPTLRGLHAAVAEIYRSEGHPDWALVEEEKERGLGRPDCGREPLDCAFAAGKYREVVTAASAAKTGEASYWLIRAYDALAAQAFARLAALPPSAQSHEQRAEVGRREGRYLESADAWRQAIALAPEDPRLKLELAVTLRLNRDFAGARQVLEELSRAMPDAAEPSYLLGDVLLAEQQPERALPLLERAVRLEPDRPHAHGALGRAYALVGRPADAIPHLERALPADEDGSLRYQLARAYQATGQAEKARIALQDYEAFRKAAEAQAKEAPITPP
jgi:predicted Zn-dependent protease